MAATMTNRVPGRTDTMKISHSFASRFRFASWINSRPFLPGRFKGILEETAICFFRLAPDQLLVMCIPRKRQRVILQQASRTLAPLLIQKGRQGERKGKARVPTLVIDVKTRNLVCDATLRAAEALLSVPTIHLPEPSGNCVVRQHCSQ
jgi:hypothetical protein